MKRPTMLAKAMLKQLSIDLGLSVERDQQKIADRCEHEGLSFLTITLPLLCDALEQGIESGTFTCPSNFARHGSLPRFLGGFFKRVFDKDGRLLPEACPDTIAGIRQILRFFKKLKMRCTESREAKAVTHFLAVEGELRRMTPQIERKDDVLDKISGIIWPQVFPEVDYHSLVCHHGPGVTADRYLSNERYRIRKWNHRSEYSFPSDLHCYPNYGIAAGCSQGKGTESESVEYLSLRHEDGVRVVFVPKTLTAPRVIAIEPSHVQYTQQAVKDLMYTVIETHSLTHNSIRFSDQSVNQRLAYSSSKDRRLATLDLKDASDRVHLHLVQRIFKNSGLLEYLEDARSLHATLPTGQNIVLFKYASMGSALCFPVEACVFYTLIQSAMHQLDGIRPSSRSIKRYSRMIDIYGDDIIVPVEYTDVVVRYLESYALKVNVNKSFRNSLFRESCGADFYNGIDIKPVYLREVPHDDSRKWEAGTIMSLNATADQFYLKGQWHIAQVIRDLLRQVVRRPIPRARSLGEGLYHFSLLYTTDLRYNRDLQCFKQKRIVYQPTKKKDDIDGDEQAVLNKWGISTALKNHAFGKGSASRWNGLPVLPFRGTLSDREDLGAGGLSHCVGHPSSEGVVSEVLNHFKELEGNTLELQDLESISDQLSSSEGSGPYRRAHALTIASSALDFKVSTKRGGFKPKRRWVSLHS